MRRVVYLYVLIFSLSVFNVHSQSKTKDALNFIMHFDTDSYEIKSSAESEMESNILQIKQMLPNVQIEIVGHTDDIGSTEYNKILSENRAQKVLQYFLSKGIPKQNIVTRKAGETEPITNNDSESGRFKNRRVSVKVTPSLKTISSIDNVTLKDTLFVINPSKSQVLNYSSGTTLKITQNSFVDSKGNPVNQEVQLSYVEYRDPIDFILSDIPMNFFKDGNVSQFISAGMFKIEAFTNNEEVFLNKNKQIEIEFTKTENLDNLNFYELNDQTKEWKELNALTKNVAPSPTVTEVLNADIILPDLESENQSFIQRKPCYYDLLTLDAGILLASDSLSIFKKYYHADEIAYKKYQDEINELTESIKNKEKSSLYYTKRKNESLLLCTVKPVENEENKLFKIYFQKNKGLKKLERIKFIGDLAHPVKEKLFSKIWNLEGLTINKDSSLCKLTFKHEEESLVLDSLKFEPDTNLQDIDYIVNSSSLIVKNKLSAFHTYQLKIENNTKDIEEYKKKIHIYQKYNSYPFTLKTDKDFKFKNFWIFNQKHMSNQELEMEMDEWFLFFDENKTVIAERYEDLRKTNYSDCVVTYESWLGYQKTVQKANAVAKETVEMLKIDNLGVFNIDRIHLLGEPVYVIADYKDVNGNKIEPLFIYILTKNLNGLLRFDNSNPTINTTHFAYNPNAETTLLAFDGEGKAYLCDYNQFKSFDHRGKKSVKQSFVLSSIDKINSKQQLASILNF